MATLDGVSLDASTRQISRTILSSVGGFSQPARRNIRTLQDLLGTIQRFHLDVFDNSSLRNDAFVGEGVSYKVYRCVHSKSKKLYAVKRVKLATSSGDFGAFERQVACVLRDVEVMSCLAEHKNILNIFGYGWNIERNNPIPFLVTEFAAEGTLRAFLKHNQVSLHEKLLFCKDVAQGIHSLHVSGIAHGDLKLDNVLVTPYIASSAVPLQQDLSEASRTSGLSACISDFGHSLHLYDDEGDSNVKQRYGGTLAYNAPEIIGEQRHARDDINFRKCDVWSLGLLCWEVLIDGHAYYHNPDIQQGIMSQQRSASKSTASSSYNPSQATSASIFEELIGIAPQLIEIASQDVSKRVSGMLSARETERLLSVFQKCLQSSPEKRLADIPLLPLLSKHDIKDGTPQRIQELTGNSWSFEIFENPAFIPKQVRALILSDYEKLANEPGESIISARAAFQLAFAYATGFTGSQDLDEAIHWFERSSAKGFGLATLYLPFLSTLQSKDDISHEVFQHQYLNFTQQALKSKFISTYSETSETPEIQPGLIDEHSFITDILAKDIPGALSEYVDLRFLLPFKLGNAEILDEHFGFFGSFGFNGSDVDLELADQDGCSALHWLFMFPEDDISRISKRYKRGYNNFVYNGEINDAIVVTTSPVNLVASNSRPFNIDPQLPLQFAGTPLSFAVAACCKPAVEALLHMGADPLCGTGAIAGLKAVQKFSAVHIAMRLHMADLLNILLNHVYSQHSLSNSGFGELLDGLSLLMSSSTGIERSIIHGSYTKLAAEETITVLQIFYRVIARDYRAWKLLMPAILRADLEVCSVILGAETPQHTNSVLFRPTELDELMIVCTEGACLVASDTSLSTKILEFGISNGASADGMYSDECIRKPIFIAIEYHQPAVMDWLIDVQQVDLNVFNEIGHTPLYALIASGFSTHYSITKLIRNGASPSFGAKGKTRLIDFAMTDATVSAFTSLLQYTEPWELEGFLEKAISLGYPEIIEAVILYAKDNNLASGIDLQFALDIAAMSSSAKVVRILLDAGADPGTSSLQAFSPLHQAAFSGNIDALKTLHKAGADVNKPSPNTEATTPLMCAIVTMAQYSDTALGARDCCNYLLDNGADPTYTDGDGSTALSILLSSVCRNRDRGVIERLLRKTPIPKYLEESDYCPIFQSVMDHDYELADLFIDYNIKLHRINSRGDTILHDCAELGTDATIDDCTSFKIYGMVGKLLAAGADPYCYNLWEELPLDEAIYADNGPVVLALLTHLKNDIKSFSRSQLMSDAHLPTIDILARKQILSVGGKIDQKPNHPVKQHRLYDHQFAGRSSGLEVTPALTVFLMDQSQQDFLRPIGNTSQSLDGSFATQDVSREAEILASRWRKAIYFGSWSSVCAFLRTGTYGPTEYMTRKAGLALLSYALQYEISDIVIQFMGDVDTIPDPYLKTIWDSLRKKLPRYREVVSIYTPVAQPVKKKGSRRFSEFVSSTMARIRLSIQPKERRPKDFDQVNSDYEVPLALWRQMVRLQYMDSIDGYSKPSPAETLLAQGLVEAEGDSVHSRSIPIPTVLFYVDEELEDDASSTMS